MVGGSDSKAGFCDPLAKLGKKQKSPESLLREAQENQRIQTARRLIQEEKARLKPAATPEMTEKDRSVLAALNVLRKIEIAEDENTPLMNAVREVIRSDFSIELETPPPQNLNISIDVARDRRDFNTRIEDEVKAIGKKESSSRLVLLTKAVSKVGGTLLRGEFDSFERVWKEKVEIEVRGLFVDTQLEIESKGFTGEKLYLETSKAVFFKLRALPLDKDNDKDIDVMGYAMKVVSKLKPNK
jgi:hypothetical protein